MTPKDPHVSGWRRDFRAADDQLERHARRLRGLVGRRLVEAWTVWIVGDDWFADLPVILCFDDGARLEVCWEKFDDLSITWNTIDVGTSPRAWVQWPLEWRRNANAALRSVVGGTVTGVYATTFRFETSTIDDPADRNAEWLTAGLWLATDRGDLRVFNALDENGLATERPERDPVRDWRPV